MKTIEEKYYNGRQSVEFEGIYQHQENKLKIEIDIDSYDFQSSANIFIFNKKDLKWNKISSIHYSQMSSKEVFYQRKVKMNGEGLRLLEKELILKDIKELKNKAKRIL